MNTITEHALPDGSVCIVEETSYRSSLISREVDDKCVWGQAFSAYDAASHGLQRADMLASMRANPSAFVRWWNA